MLDLYCFIDGGSAETHLSLTFKTAVQPVPAMKPAADAAIAAGMQKGILCFSFPVLHCFFFSILQCSTFDRHTGLNVHGFALFTLL